MAFLITMPNGKKYRVEGAATQEEALQHLQQQLQAANTPADPVAADAQAQMSAMTQHPGPAIAEQQRQRDVADYAALPAWKRPVADVIDLANTSGRAATGLVSGAYELGKTLLNPDIYTKSRSVGDVVSNIKAGYNPTTPEEIVARFKSGQSSGPAFDAEVAKQKRQTEAARNRLQWAAPVADAAPLMMAPIAKVAEGLPLLNTVVSGAGYGAATAAGNKEDPLLGAAGGAAGAAGGHVVGQGLGWLLNKGLGYAGKAVEAISPSLAAKTGLKVPPIAPIAPAPTAKELKTLSTAAFNKADEHGVIFNSQGLHDLGRKIEADLADRVWTPENEPGLVPALRRFNEYLKTGNVTFKGLRALRRAAGNGYRFGMKSNNSAVTSFIHHIDDFVDEMNPAHMAANTTNPAAAAEAARQGRALYSRMAKLETVQNLIKRGELQGDTNINKNVRQSVRKQLVKIIDPTRSHGRGFTTAEKAAVEKATSTSATQDVAHALSGLMPRDKLSTAIHMASLAPTAAGGFMVGGPLGAALAVPAMAAKLGLGYAAGKVADRMAQRSVDELVHMIASGGLPKQTAQSVLQRLTASKRKAVIAGLGRAGMGFGGAAANQLYRAYGQNEPANP